MPTPVCCTHALTALALALAAAGTASAQEAGRVVQAIGQASLATQAAKAGDSVQAGQVLQTGADSYLYIKTTDGGFLILRPHSQARVLAYHIDPADPAQTRIKIELTNGVARSISGSAVKAARQHFRFNTPLAAIGVRGTDFTVFTTDQTTRVAVVSGGVAVSGFGEGCSADGYGPCEGASTRELFAGQDSQVLQVNRGQTLPLLLRGNTLLPDASAPPRADEPAKSATSAPPTLPTPDPSLAPLKLAELDKQLGNTGASAAAPAPPIIWGRWQPLLGVAPESTLSELRQGHQLIGINSYYALLRQQDNVWQTPSASSASFAMQTTQVVVQADGAGAIVPASLENGQLNINFANSRFSTQFDLLTLGQRSTRMAEGRVFADGTFANVNQFMPGNNMLVQGVLASTPSLQAAYLFQSKFYNTTPDGQSTGWLASGVTHWTR